jgi:hypothetical protein
MTGNGQEENPAGFIFVGIFMTLLGGISTGLIIKGEINAVFFIGIIPIPAVVVCPLIFLGGFFIPNDRKKYSVGENAGMKLNEDSGIEIYVAAEQPPGVPDENWLPINRQDEALDIIMRIYAPDLEKMETWVAPQAEKLTG